MQRTALRCLPGICRRPIAQYSRQASRSILLNQQLRQVRRISQEEHTTDNISQNANDISAAAYESLGDDPDQSESPSSSKHWFPPSSRRSEFARGATVIVHGFLGKRRDKSSSLTFCKLDTDGQVDLQIISMVPTRDQGCHARELHAKLKGIPAFSPVVVTGQLDHRPRRVGDLKDEGGDGVSTQAISWDLRLTSIQPLNEFSKDIIVSKDTVWGPSQRHLQLRFDSLLRNRLQLRSKANFVARKCLASSSFHEYETPVLFKSTPEGAREFIVPTRRRGLAYALPQSPQQYKQVLMASGIRRYYQFARCFRDEDSRADRQPEFTQLDLEMAFATGKDVMSLVESIIISIFKQFRQNNIPREIDGVLYSSHEELTKRYGASALPETEWTPSVWPLRGVSKKGFTRITYDNAMARFGSDKPDLRIPSQIQPIDDFLPEDFKKMITNLEDPVVEAIQFKLTGSPSENLSFIREFMDNLPKTTLKLKSASTPGIFVFDETKPLNGLAAFGHVAGEQIATLQNEWWPQLQHGDLLIVHARERAHFQGEGWTELGRLRKVIYDAAVQKGLMKRDISFKFCWIIDFPLFTPDIEPGEGQGGAAGLKATHHPFTAPLKPLSKDDLASIDEGRPWEVKAEHYDLVLNGTEVGGGSRRIHQRAMQEYVMRTILKMPNSGIQQFQHLLEALDAGCPPHAGFALGWDRFITLLCDVDSVRDVLAFPKNMKGEDQFVKSPSQLTQSQMNTYWLSPKGWVIPEQKLW
ncbi:aspartyl-tRNA synthetase [Seiridium cupressi]